MLSSTRRRLPLPDHVPLQLIAVRDIGEIAAALLLEHAKTPHGAIEVAGDARTGSQMAAAFGEHAGLPARYEALPLAVLGGSEDARAMFRWFAETSAYQADLDEVRAIQSGGKIRLGPETQAGPADVVRSRPHRRPAACRHRSTRPGRPARVTRRRMRSPRSRPRRAAA
ncbi:NmrA family NAD(P)-binding protein, partial [Amycolatopsis mediterranei]|uniref:NmrA family NAD(P)-binding protein n=1 Tax=Amycolatopsis mediterranei TaxID=33910 RepID=UPI003316E185